MMICLLAEDVLLLQTVTLAQCLEHVVPDIHVGIVLIRIGTPLLYRILYLEDRRRIAVPGIQDGIRNELEPILNRQGLDAAYKAYTKWKAAGGFVGHYRDYVDS